MQEADGDRHHERDLSGQSRAGRHRAHQRSMSRCRRPSTTRLTPTATATSSSWSSPTPTGRSAARANQKVVVSKDYGTAAAVRAVRLQRHAHRWRDRPGGLDQGHGEAARRSRSTAVRRPSSWRTCTAGTARSASRPTAPTATSATKVPTGNGTGIKVLGNNNTVHNGAAQGNTGVGVQVDGNSNYVTDTDVFANGVATASRSPATATSCSSSTPATRARATAVTAST